MGIFHRCVSIFFFNLCHHVSNKNTKFQYFPETLFLLLQRNNFICILYTEQIHMVIIITDASSTVHKNIIKFMRQYVNIFNLNTHRKIRFTFVNISRCTPGRCNIRHPVLFMIRHESRTLICLCADPWILCKQVRTSSDRRYY